MLEEKALEKFTAGKKALLMSQTQEAVDSLAVSFIVRCLTTSSIPKAQIDFRDTITQDRLLTSTDS